MATILLVSDDAFQGAYIAGVLRARGINVAGPLSDASVALAALAEGDVRAAILGVRAACCPPVPLLAALQNDDIPLLILLQNAASSLQHSDATFLVQPFAAYQVADWVAAACALTPPLEG